MYHVSAQGVGERMVNVHYYYYYQHMANHVKQRVLMGPVLAKMLPRGMASPFPLWVFCMFCCCGYCLFSAVCWAMYCNNQQKLDGEGGSRKGAYVTVLPWRLARRAYLERAAHCIAEQLCVCVCVWGGGGEGGGIATGLNSCPFFPLFFFLNFLFHFYFFHFHFDLCNGTSTYKSAVWCHREAPIVRTPFLECMCNTFILILYVCKMFI